MYSVCYAHRATLGASDADFVLQTLTLLVGVTSSSRLGWCLPMVLVSATRLSTPFFVAAHLTLLSHDSVPSSSGLSAPVYRPSRISTPFFMTKYPNFTVLHDSVPRFLWIKQHTPPSLVIRYPAPRD